ncbi:hypothetical protein PG996_003061 [Apiospora saccharicola]|uniref:Uncharacterized protein n=1 Tax=Apiospora saccharicola TaxID=335842 RepID=A0ABR1W063_9PEZI
MLLNIYDGKFWSTQALFIGMEGVPSILAFVEERLFGSARGRLKWSVAGIQLSRHELSQDGECVGLPPLLDNNDERTTANIHVHRHILHDGRGLPLGAPAHGGGGLWAGRGYAARGVVLVWLET